MRDIVKQHKETFDEDNLRDFVDVYLKEMRSTPDVSFTEEELLVVSMDMFTAGSETTSTTLAWAVNYMITHPEIQARVQAEIDAVLGDRPPSLEDKEALNFTVATIMEIQVQSVKLKTFIGINKCVLCSEGGCNSPHGSPAQSNVRH